MVSDSRPSTVDGFSRRMSEIDGAGGKDAELIDVQEIADDCQ